MAFLGVRSPNPLPKASGLGNLTRGTWLGPRDTRREDVVKADSDSAKQNTDQIKQNTDQIKPANGRLYELKLSQSI